MATAPVYSSAVIEALRNAPDDSLGIASGVRLLPNPQNIGSTINFTPRSRSGLLFDPSVLRLPTAAPPPIKVKPPATPKPPPVVTEPPPRVSPPLMPAKPTITVVDDSFVGPIAPDEVEPLPDDLVGPLPDDFVGPLPEEPVAEPAPVLDQPIIEVIDLPPLDFFDPLPPAELEPSVTVNENLDVTDTPAPYTDPAENFEIDRELGLVQQTDVVNPPPVPPPPIFNPPLTPISTSAPRSLTPSVTVNEGLDVTPGPALYTDPADDFELDRELGLVQQSDVFVGPAPSVEDQVTTAPEPLPAPINTIANVGNVTDVSINPDDFSMYADMLNTDITSTLPAAVPALTYVDMLNTDITSTLPQAVPERQLTEEQIMALFDMLAEQNLTRGPRGMTYEETVDQ